MGLEVARLMLGLMIALFHRPLAIKMMQHERTLDFYFRSRGVNLPAPLSDSSAQTLYFSIGILICLIEAARIWFSTGF